MDFSFIMDFLYPIQVEMCCLLDSIVYKSDHFGLVFQMTVKCKLQYLNRIIKMDITVMVNF